ncbi:MAG: toxin-antitoxin system HicB family antitoxin [Clostridia bacterium]|nr:toxin-antitoxin system HicB family antitoxin [Clostridia bacterium]
MSIQEYMELPYNIIVKKMNDESGVYFSATVLEFDGCMGSGDTYEDAYADVLEAMEGWIETKLENGFSVPLPMDAEKYSGKFVIRIPKTLHQELSIKAAQEGVSLNQYALYKLAH